MNYISRKGTANKKASGGKDPKSFLSNKGNLGAEI